MARNVTLRRPGRSIRSRVLAIALVPSAALLVVGIVLAAYVAVDSYRTWQFANKTKEVSLPAVDLILALQEERRLTIEYIVTQQPDRTRLAIERNQVDAALQRVAGGLAELGELAPEEVQQSNVNLTQELQSLPAIRKDVDDNRLDVLEAYDAYNAPIQAFVSGISALGAAAPTAAAANQQSLSSTLLLAADSMARSYALGTAAVQGEGLNSDQFNEYVKQVGAYHLALETTAPSLQGNRRQEYASLVAGRPWGHVQEVESALTEGGVGGAGRSQSQDTSLVLQDEVIWSGTSAWVALKLQHLFTEQALHADDVAAAAGRQQFFQALAACAVMLLAALIALVIALRLSNGLVQRLFRLREDTLSMADTRLPETVERLRRGEQVDVETEVPALNYGDDEIGQVAEAFNKAQRTAVAAAVQEAETRAGTRAVFLNIAHRSQVIVHRQLKVLDQAERSQDDPDQLSLLFQLDHLATRARRHAENLIILGGDQPGRQWRNPVSLVQIVRSAISETEHYVRVTTGPLPGPMMEGAVVADLIHLLAELIDNATSFSPPTSRVEVRGMEVGRGVVIEVEDQGLGMEPQQREELNATLHEPPDFSMMALSSEPRLGLFVVARLAARHGIQVTLAESPYGGTRAIALIPSTLIASSPTANGSSEQPAISWRAADQPDRMTPLPAARQITNNRPLPSRAAGRTSGPATAGPSTPGASSRPDPAMTPPSGITPPAGMSPITPATPIRPPAPPQSPPVGIQPTGPETPVHGVAFGVTGVPNFPTLPASSGNTGSFEPRRPSTPDGERPPLPRRRRQANLAPQLSRELHEEEPEADEPYLPTAEQARDRLAAFQRGTQQARDDDSGRLSD